MTRAPALIALGFVAVATIGCSSTPSVESTPPPPLDVGVARASVADLADRLEAGGIVAANESAIVASRVMAQVMSVHVHAGDVVHGADVVVTLDSRDLAAQARQTTEAVAASEQGLERARSDEVAATADHTLAVAWHTRIAALHARNAATTHELDEARARLAAASAREAAARAAVEEASARLRSLQAAAEAATITESFTVLRAPFDGVVTERLIDPGSLAAPGVPLLRVETGGARRVEVLIDEARASYVRPGDDVEVVLEMPDAPASSERVVSGTVTEVDRAVAVDQRAFRIKIALPASLAPRTGTFARVLLPGERRRAVVVPVTAVRRQGQVTSVFVVQGAVVRLRLIQIGAADADRVEVVAGLDGSETLVTSFPPGLEDGQPVTVVSAAPEATAVP